MSGPPQKQLSRSPEETASFVSRIFFLWIGGLIKKARRQTLKESDIWEINKRDKCQNIYPLFEKQWTKTRSETQTRSSYDHQLPLGDGKNLKPRIFTEDNIRHRNTKTQDSTVTQYSQDNQPSEHVESPQEQKNGHASLIVVLLKTFWSEIACCQGLRLVHAVSTWLANPFFIGLLIEATADQNTSIWVSVVLTIAMVSIQMLGKIADEQSSYIRQVINLHMDMVLQNTVFRKALNLHTSSRSKYSIGQMTNLMSSDVGNISSRFCNLLFLSFTPINIIVVFGQLFFILGPAAAMGIVVIALILPFNRHVERRIASLFVENSKNKDEKMKLLNEVLTGMKVLKLNAWEPCFGDMLKFVRHREVEILKKMTYYRALHIFSWNTAPYVISVAMFCGYFILNPDSILTVKAAFAVTSALHLLRLSINLGPDIINEINKIRISVNRLELFLNEKEFIPINTELSKDDVHIEIEDATFSWGTSEKPVLRNISISLSRPNLMAVVGQVGTGKSALMLALLGEIEKNTGHISIKGSTAYVPQQSWIQNDTLQNNILFGKPMDRQVYRKVIDVCALQPDIDLLPAGDKTEIGERGINLSGGQKQRVSLARAVYNDADIYLLDDPLSAVDSHVGKHIFDNVIKGMLKDKICVLVTHNLRYLPQVDNIIVLNNGTVAENGSFRQLLNSDGAFTNVLKTYLTDFDENKDCIEDLELEDNPFLDAEMKTKLKRLESEEFQHDNLHMQQRSRELQRSTSRNLSTTDDENEHFGDGKLIEEEKQVDADSKITFQILFRYIQAYGPWNMSFLLVFYLLYYGTYIEANMLMVWWMDDEILKNINESHSSPEEKDIMWRTNMFYLSIYAFLGILMSLFIFLYAYMMSRGVVRASQHSHENMLNSILRAPMSFFDTTPVGRITNRFGHDMKIVDDVLPSCLEFWLDGVFNVVIGLAFVLYSTPNTIALLIPILYYYIHLQREFIPARKQMLQMKVKAMSPVESYFTESVTGSEVIRAFRHQPRFNMKMQDAIDHFQKMKIYSNVLYRWLGASMFGLGYVIFGATTLAKSFTKGTASAAMVGFGTSFSLELNGNMRWLVSLHSDLETNLLSVGRIEQYINSPNEAEWRKNTFLLPPNWPENGKLEFRNYSLRYRQGLDLVLRNISFTVREGEKIGVVGRTGAGKSSLVLSLFRLVEPTEGAILIDGVDIANIGLHDLREKLAIIPQDPILFTGSLRRNLDPQNLYTNKDIWTALDHTHLREFVESLPDRLQTDCGEGGNNFSVGQRQLFCMARTLLRKARILVLDEATAAVDMETDDLIQQTIRSEFKDCTVLTIAHRLNTVMDYDRILALDKGSVTEFDTPASLLQRRDGIFYNMARASGLIS